MLTSSPRNLTLVAGIVLAIGRPLIGQDAPVAERRTTPTVAQGNQKPDTTESQPAPQEAALPEPFLLSPGHYVYPDEYRPDYWSPHIRPFPDYNPDLRGRSRGLSRLPFQPLGQYSNPGYFGGWNYGGVPYLWDTAGAYAQGRYDADHEYVWYIASQRAGRLLNQFRDQFDTALVSFRNGKYDRALVSLLGAAEKNHASGAARLHIGHALFALGRYREGVRFLARAFELSPSLAYKEYDIRDEYGDKSDFDRQLSALKDYVRRNPTDSSGHTMLGYVTFFTEGPGAAWRPLEDASRLNPDSYFVPKLLNVARLARGAATPEQLERALGRSEVNPAEQKLAAPEVARPAQARPAPAVKPEEALPKRKAPSTVGPGMKLVKASHD